MRLECKILGARAAGDFLLPVKITSVDTPHLHAVRIGALDDWNTKSSTPYSVVPPVLAIGRSGGHTGCVCLLQSS